MKVKDLIAQLEKCPPDSEIMEMGNVFPTYFVNPVTMKKCSVSNYGFRYVNEKYSNEEIYIMYSDDEKDHHVNNIQKVSITYMGRTVR